MMVRVGLIVILASATLFLGRMTNGVTSLQKSPQRPPCSLNGALDANDDCVCDAPWSGPDCSTMNFKPVRFPQGYGMEPNVTSWGGHAIFDGLTYHLYVAVMTNGCSLRTWTRNSRIDHAVSNTITGPYKFKDVAINTWSHNPAPISLPDGTYAIVHIGDASGQPDGGKNCSGFHTSVDRRRARTATGSSIHIAQSLDGPWVPLKTNALNSCNNPSPFVHQNGTIFIVCNNNILMRSKSISGPWTVVTSLQHSNGPPGTYEDAFLYIDDRGFHLLWHVYNTNEHPPHGHECIDSTVSAHSYSEDGFSWFLSPIQPYGTQVVLSDGNTITVATRERPKLFFDENGRMTHLFNGVCGAPACPDGPPTGCVDCKYDSWDFTLIAPLLST